MYVLTLTGMKQCKELTDDDSVFDGKVFIKPVIESKENDEVCNIKTLRGYEICGNFDVECYSSGKLNKINVNNINVNDLIVSHKSNAYDCLYNKVIFDCDAYQDTSKNQKYILPKLLTDEFSYFLGYSYGDGCFRIGKNLSLSLACSDDYPEIKTKLTRVVKNTFDYYLKIYKGDGRLENMTIQRKKLLEFFIANGIAKQKAGFLLLPKTVFNSNSKNVMSFFSGHFDADGYASGHKKGYCLYSIDYKILKEYQLYLSLMNIVSTIHSEDRSKQGWQTMWTLHIFGGGSQENLIKRCSESLKITNKQFIAKRDFVKTPYTPKNIGIAAHRCGVESNECLISFMTLQNLNIEGCQEKYINDVVAIEKYKKNCVGFKNVDSLWCNGFIVKP